MAARPFQWLRRLSVPTTYRHIDAAVAREMSSLGMAFRPIYCGSWLAAETKATLGRRARLIALRRKEI